MIVIETDRLTIRWLTVDDSSFILELLNDPLWLKFIGDKGVKTLEDSKNYILSGPMKMYAQYGFGLYLTELKENGVPIGICGLIKRDSLEDIDIGFAFLSKFHSRGYAYEAASATLLFAQRQLNLSRVVAITSIGNRDSSKLLEKIGMSFERHVTLSEDTEELKLFGITF